MILNKEKEIGYDINLSILLTRIRNVCTQQFEQSGKDNLQMALLSASIYPILVFIDLPIFFLDFRFCARTFNNTRDLSPL
jgi:hypothetical protein